MASGFTFLDPHSPIKMAVLVSGVIGIGGFLARRSLEKTKNPLVPDEKLSARNLAELLAEFLVWLGDTAMGKENRKYLPFCGTLFLYILIMNASGLIPGFTMPTDQFQFNLGVGLVVFTMYTFWGVKEVGVGNYLKHLWGPVFLVGFLLFPIELISHSVRPISLSLRLYGNMTGDHMALASFTDLTRSLFIPVPVVFYMLGTLVCTIQAFVFTILSMIYIRLAVSHDH